MSNETVSMTVGQRIKFHRQRAGKTRPVLGGLVGKSPEWVKAVETGRILPPRLPMLDRLARVLKVSLADLVGDPALPPDLPVRVMRRCPPSGTRSTGIRWAVTRPHRRCRG
jgi:transcriptional regulator with XRE-family HTH domain